MLNNNSFLGRGWAFPPTFNANSGEVELVEDIEDIRQSLAILLSTSLGERILQPEYGCNLSDYQFEPLSATNIGFIRDLVSNAILFFEPRIRVEEVRVTDGLGLDAREGRVLIDVEFTVRSTNSRFNFVYDFYRTEGSQAFL